MAIISTETKLVRLLQGMLQDLALTCLISGRRAGALAHVGGVLLIKAEQVAVCHKFTSVPGGALLFPSAAQCNRHHPTSDLYTPKIQVQLRAFVVSLFQAL